MRFVVLAVEGINPDGSEPIGWLSGIYALGLFIVVGLLFWSFVRTMRRTKETWAVDSRTRNNDEGGDGSANRPGGS